uniref:Uncharacterized protein n=1 Tax=Schlesneria paludicola TaxID=360056 RepID=A0A7C4QXM1_9PLAN
MTFLGKVLVVVQLGLAVLFMAFAGAVFTSQVNWRAAHEQAKKALDAAQSKAQTDLNALQTQLDQLQQRYNQLLNEKTALEGQVTTLTDDNKRLDADNKALKIEVDVARTAAQLATQEAEERSAESKLQRARNAELNDSRNATVAELNAERDRIFALQLELAQIKQKEAKLLKDLAVMRNYLASKDLPTDPKLMTVGSAPPPPVDGKILEARPAARGQRMYVEVSLGQDDGLVVGHEMTVYRGDKYKGKIRLEDVRPDKSVGVVVETAPNSKIEKDDYVTTRL